MMVNEEKQNCMKKPHAKSIGVTKVVYARDNDPQHTLVIRNCYDRGNDYHKLFGIKGESLFSMQF